jgi:hypothetical protein
MLMKELYKMIASKGLEYVQNPEHRAQIIKVSFVVMMKLFTMVRNRFKKKEDQHIECNCNSCKVWRAKVNDAFKKECNENKSYVSSVTNLYCSKYFVIKKSVGLKPGQNASYLSLIIMFYLLISF